MAKKLRKTRIKASKSNQSDGKDDGGATSVPTSPVDDAQVEVPPIPIPVDVTAATAATPATAPAPAAAPPPPPPPPPPAPPISTSPTFKPGPRVVRRQSTSGTNTPSARAGAHARSATDPSSSTPNLPLTAKSDNFASSPTPPIPLPTLIAQAALKRSNTINSFGRRTPSPSSSPRRPGILGDDDGVAVIQKNGNGNENGDSNSNGKENDNENTTSTTTNARRTSSPPPAIKPKPASLTLNKTSKKLVAHERSASALLRTALVQGANAAVQSSNANSSSSSNSNSHSNSNNGSASGSSPSPSPGSNIPRFNTINGKPTIEGTREAPERKGSVAKLARSLESTLQFSAPPSPGTPPALPRRSSVASTKSLRSVRSVRNGNGEDGVEKEDVGEEAEEERGTEQEAERDEREEGQERISAAPPANFKAVVASLIAKGIKANASSNMSDSTRPTTGAKKSTPAPVPKAVVPVPAPSPPPTPPLSPPSSAMSSEMFTAPESPAFPPPPLTPPSSASTSASAPSQTQTQTRPRSPPQRTSSTSPPPAPPKPPSRASKPKFLVERREVVGEEVEVVNSEPASSPKTTVVPPASSASGPESSSPKQEAKPADASAEAQAAAAEIGDDPEKAELAVVSAPTSTIPKRFSVAPSRPPPPLPEEPEAADLKEEAEDEAGEDTSEDKDDEETSPTPKETKPAGAGAEVPAPRPVTPASPPPPTPAKSAKRYSVPPPPRPPPPPPVEVDEEIAEEVEEGEEEGDKVDEGRGQVEGEETPTKPSRPQRPVPDLPPRTPVVGPTQDADTDADTDGVEVDAEDGAVLGGIVVQEPEELDELAGIADEHGQVHLRLEGEEYDSANDSSDDERYESCRTALSRNGSTSLPPTPPTKHGPSFPLNLTSKWSRNTSAVPSANASASTLALDRTQVPSRAEAVVEVYTDEEEAGEEVEEEDASLEDTTLAHANVHELAAPDDNAKGSKTSLPNNDKEVKEVRTMQIPMPPPMPIMAPSDDPMDGRFKFPPVESFPPPQPLPLRRNTDGNINPSNRKAMAFANGSETSLASIGEGREDNESADDADRESTAPRKRKQSKTKAVLRSAVLAALGKSIHPTGPVAEPIPEGSSPSASHAEGETETMTLSSDDGSNPITWQVRARLAKLDANEDSSSRPAPFPTSGDGEHGQSQSAPEVPLASRRPGAGMGSPEDEMKKRQVRLSSKLLPITSPARMNTSPSTPSTITAWGKHKMVMSSETVGTIGTIATEPGDLEQSQFGLSTIGSRTPPPSSFFLHRMKSDASRKQPVRRQTTSQSSRFVEDLPFFKRSTSPTSMSQSPSQYQSPAHQRAATVSFSSRMRTGSMGTVLGPPTRKNSIVPELRAATIEAAERPLSAVSGDFVLVEEPEEFDIPRAEWDLPRIPSGSLRFPSSMDLRAKMAQAAAMNGNNNMNGNGNGRQKGGPSSAPATSSPLVPVSLAPVMQHSRSETTGTTGTSGTSSTTKSSASAPAAPFTAAQANTISFQMSSGSDGAGGGTGPRGGRLSSDELLDLWGRVGVYMSDAAALLHDKSRRVLVGDGTFPGFVLAVARQVPTACIPSKTARYPYGHLIYFQTAGTVHKRYAEILPGDVVVLQNALFKGVRGPLHQSYQEELGTKGDPVVGVIGEFEARKSKVRVYQANQHVGIQTVEYVSYRFEDLKSGTIKIFRVPES